MMMSQGLARVGVVAEAWDWAVIVAFLQQAAAFTTAAWCRKINRSHAFLQSL
jgi:hypothetical protein